MSIFYIEDNLILDQGSDVLKNQFNNHCEWCWGHGFGNCDVCKKAFKHYYLPIRIKELQKKNGIDCEKQIPTNRSYYPRRYEVENWIERHNRRHKSRKEQICKK